MEISIYEVAGGEQALSDLAAAFYRRVLTDPMMLPLFERPDDDHAGRMALFLGEYFGGHAEHTRQRGGRTTMAHIHDGLRISDRQRDRWIEHMRAACEEVQIPEAFMAHFEPMMQHFAPMAQEESWR
jgi:hemoglobin